MFFASPWIAALVAMFLWWFSTGIILLLVRGADRADKQGESTLLMLPILCLGAVGFWLSKDTNTLQNVYIAFLSALAIWGWIELAFLNGIITGPNRSELPPETPEWERFIRAWGTIAYHEMLLVAALITLGFVAATAPNAFGFWTFAVLFFARISAKLNLFFGVPKINTEFLPSALAHLPSHFRHAKMNWLFPVSVTALTFAAACWLERIYASFNAADIVGFALLAALTALALLEHWFMVLPLPDEKLWRWMLPARKEQTKTTRLSEEAHGL
ncbi:putative photosynthetic complex assembly protein 2 [Litoreibacter ponti]|uniref:Putative photosynthetic complex assembly protein 2 n=1 Tax=Litoreibacter ponti TaxID=1510457 RepID=A0A2T6BPT3_9RHOB|nr:putative photosynthetic complex assembly protein PuhE [Litoreibacter ponti]PTX57987.1 putative photosynthetic complex assembly protein 2 [Litoreibacter ponti]